MRYYLRLSVPWLKRLAIDGEDLPDFHGYLFCPQCGLARSSAMRDLLRRFRSD